MRVCHTTLQFWCSLTAAHLANRARWKIISWPTFLRFATSAGNMAPRGGLVWYGSRASMDGQTGFIVRNRNNHAGLDRVGGRFSLYILLFLFLLVYFTSWIPKALSEQQESWLEMLTMTRTTYLWSITTPGGGLIQGKCVLSCGAKRLGATTGGDILARDQCIFGRRGREIGQEVCLHRWPGGGGM